MSRTVQEGKPPVMLPSKVLSRMVTRYHESIATQESELRKAVNRKKRAEEKVLEEVLMIQALAKTIADDRKMMADFAVPLGIVERHEMDYQLEFPGLEMPSPCAHSWTADEDGNVICASCDALLSEVTQLAQPRKPIADREEAAAVASIAPESTEAEAAPEPPSEPATPPEESDEPRVTGKLAQAVQEVARKGGRRRTTAA